MYRILSIDGGGLRGLIPLQLLNKLQQQYPNFLDKVDMFAGTSTGGIIACGLSLGMSPEELANFYLSEGSNIFKSNIYRKLDITSSKYTNDGLKKAATKIFGSNKISDLKKKILVCSFRLDGFDKASGLRKSGPKMFNSWDDKDATLVDVCLSTSAAPTYFPIHGSMIDGGVVANNPVMCAVCQALNKGIKLEDIEVISFGTGKYPTFLEDQNADWGPLAWMRHGLIDIIMDGGEGIPDFQCRMILKERYIRVQTCLPEKLTKMDKPEMMDDLLIAAQIINIEYVEAVVKKWCEA